MRFIFTGIFIILLSLFPTHGSGQSIPKEFPPFAVIELFTSEGCSSCPPADQFLTKLTVSAHVQKARIFPLAFHVDYWNYLGWVDRYSDSEFSLRQRIYAKILKEDNVYTPQMIINGIKEFPGYRSDMALELINKALNKPAKVGILLSPEIHKDQKMIAVRYEVWGASPDAILNLAFVQRGIINEIKAGENKGLTLQHNNIVRAFKIVKLDHSQGKVSFKSKEPLHSEFASIIAYVQDPATMEILGAENTDLKF